MPRCTLKDLGLPAPPIIAGHRGASRAAPENTLPSFAMAVRQGADMVELDLHLTADGELIASHDNNARRTAGVDMVIEETPYETLRGLNVSAYFGVFEPTTMPRLAEILAAVPPDFPLNLELKRETAGAGRYVDAVVAGLTRDRLLLSSFDWELLRAVRERLPSVPLAPIADRNAADLPGAVRALHATSAHCNYQTVTPEMIAELGSVPLLAYTLDEVAVAEGLFAIGVAGVFTNDPGRFVTHFRGMLRARSSSATVP